MASTVSNGEHLLVAVAHPKSAVPGLANPSLERMSDFSVSRPESGLSQIHPEQTHQEKALPVPQADQVGPTKVGASIAAIGHTRSAMPPLPTANAPAAAPTRFYPRVQFPLAFSRHICSYYVHDQRRSQSRHNASARSPQ